MKKIITVGCLAVIASCQDQSQHKSPDEIVVNDTTVVATIQIPKTGCYSYMTGKDTLWLKVETFPNVATGMLTYALHEKDRNTGELDGKFTGDTLVAEYTFMSEGTRSVRQVAFLVKDSLAMEGYGDMEEKDGKTVFKNIHQLDFSKSLHLQKVPCEEQVAGAATLTASGGSEGLYKHSWELSELDGKAVGLDDTARIPQLALTPGQVNRVSGTTGCNRIMGTFEIGAAHKLVFSPLGTTRMACAGTNIEAPFLAAIAKVDQFSVPSDKSMILMSHGKAILVFKAK